jgi:hypothetical protein
MSAFLCDNSHLSYMAGFAVANGLTTASAESVAELLYITNMKSLIARYGQKAADDGQFEFDASGAQKGAERADAAQIVMSASCFAYQACEFAEWDRTRAYSLIEAIKAAALARTPFQTLEALQATSAYDACSWGGPH